MDRIASLDAVFEHVRGAMNALEDNRPESALRLLGMIYGDLAVHALRNTNADPASPHWMMLVAAIEREFPPDNEWGQYVGEHPKTSFARKD